MNTRFRLGISTIVIAAAVGVSPAHAAVTVIGGGLAKDCYDAVEFEKVRPAEALATCDLAIEQELMSRRNMAATLVNRGILHMRAQRNAMALRDFERSLDLIPNLLEAKVNLGGALYGLQRYEEAMAALNSGIETDSVDARAIGYYNRALTHEKLGDLQAAYEDFRSALETKPDFTQAAEQMARFTVVKVPS
jgi:tetratricopeptide (TPR) repeat protein